MTSPGAAPVRPSARRRGYRLFWTTIWLFFLINPLEAALRLEDATDQAIALSGLGLFALTYIAFFALTASETGGHLRWTPVSRRAVQRRAWQLLPVLVLLIVPVGLTAGGECLTMPVYVAVAGMFSLPGRWAWSLSLALAVASEILARTISGWHDQSWSAAFSVVFASAAMYGIRQASRRAWETQALRTELAERALDDEKARMTRDLHDILGHSLTVITVKAELAGRLVEASPQSAGQEIADIERLSREALADVRATISGRRTISLTNELVNARSALEAAGISADLPRAVDSVTAQQRELFGWAVREGVTNVVRHSAAQRCVVEVDGGTLSVHDDGHGPDHAAPGNGLSGLRARARTLGGTLTTERSTALGGFRLTVDVPEEPQP